MIPQRQGVQAWDRYAYTNNNPITYNDPSGHCLILCTAIIGAAIGFTVNYVAQTFHNMQAGMNIGEAASFSNINHQELAVATVGGFVGGLTLGAGTALVGAARITGTAATITTSIIGGAASNVAAGQAEAITNAAIDQMRTNISFEINSEGQHMINFAPNLNQFANDAHKYGFGQSRTLIRDAIAGGVAGGFSAGLQGVITDIGTPAAEYLGRQPASWIRPASRGVDWLEEYFEQNDKENNPQ
jgi:hypothetical protein